MAEHGKEEEYQRRMMATEPRLAPEPLRAALDLLERWLYSGSMTRPDLDALTVDTALFKDRQASPQPESRAVELLRAKGILGTRLDDIRARANAGQPMKSFWYYRANGMWDSYRPFIEEAQEDRLALLAALDAFLADSAAPAQEE